MYYHHKKGKNDLIADAYINNKYGGLIGGFELSRIFRAIDEKQAMTTEEINQAINEIKLEDLLLGVK
jgi:hypothetical protein